MASANFGKGTEIMIVRANRKEFPEKIRSIRKKTRDYLAGFSTQIEEFLPLQRLGELTENMAINQFDRVFDTEGKAGAWGGREWKYPQTTLHVYISLLDIVKRAGISGFEEVNVPKKKIASTGKSVRNYEKYLAMLDHYEHAGNGTNNVYYRIDSNTKIQLLDDTFAWYISDHVGGADQDWIEVLKPNGKRVRAYDIGWWEVCNP
jgi:hypothetical protein